MNFWFTTCKPCVGELGDLENLNKELAEKGGQVVGVNSFTLDGNKGEIADAKDVLSKKGVTYKNIWFKSDSEAGKFTSNLFSFPTTYVIDQNGNIVGGPSWAPSAPPSSARRSISLSIRRLRIASSRKRVKHGEDRAPLCGVVRYLSR
ncbi:MAG: TlpA disulfide reductase family protein [Collinsella sp.]